jgi:serine protease Do
MKQTTKNILGVAAVVILSSGVAGVTTYKMLNKEKPATFSELFEQNPNNLQLAAYNATDAQPVDLTQAAENSVHAVVHIRAKQLSKTQTVQGMPDIFDFFFGDGRGQQRQIQTQPRVGFGSGVIISKDGYIVTNNHVVEGADEITVKLNDDRELKGRIIGTDPSTDLALIKIEGDDFPTVPVGNSDELKIGEWVLAVGNPLGLTSTVTAGIVSAKARSISALNPRSQKMGIEAFIQTDAAVNPGNSGGALVNTAGELVGINTAIYSETGSYAGYSFAIPTSIVSKVIADLKEYGTVQRAVLGIGYREIDSELAKEENLEVQEGIYVGEVYNRSAAMEAGIKEGDVITFINGVKIKNGAMLSEQLSKYRPGDKIKIGLLRGKESKTVSLTLKNSQGNTEITKIAGMDSLGAGFKELDAKSLREMNIRYGVQVIGLKNGKFKAAGMREGFVILEINNTPMKSVSDLESMYDSIVKSNQNQKVMFITGIYPNGKMMYYAVDLAD